MSELHEISGCDNEDRKADVIFVHGLGGDAFETWTHPDDPNAFWPKWLGEDFPQVGVWSLGYVATKSNVARNSSKNMPLLDLAVELLELLSLDGIGSRPLMFVCHSMGGLLVKHVIRKAFDLQKNNQERRELLSQTKAVFFLATPHSGSELASYADFLARYFASVNRMIAVNVSELQLNSHYLQDLLEWYSNNAVQHGIETKSYTETTKTKIKGPLRKIVVNRSSSDPGVPGFPSIPLPGEDHFSIAIPSDRTKTVYKAARKLLHDYVLSGTPVESPDEQHELRYQHFLDSQLNRDTLFAFFGTRNDHLIPAFVQLDLADAGDVQDEDGLSEEIFRHRSGEEVYSTAEEALVKAIVKKKKVLVIIGEPGGGKTTIIRRYGTNPNLSLSGVETSFKVTYLPLQEMNDKDTEQITLVEMLALFAAPEKIDASWLEGRIQAESSLVLLDGLDEISDDEQRKKVCQWIAKSAKSTTFGKATFVLTSRTKGFRQAEQQALDTKTIRCYAKQFNSKQQKEFLENWFRAGNICDPETEPDMVMSFINGDGRGWLKQIAGIPMMLGFIAFYWERNSGREQGEREKLESRGDLYRETLVQMLAKRDEARNLSPPISAPASMELLKPVALWIQKTCSKESVEKSKFQEKIRKKLKHVPVNEYCQWLVKRAGILDCRSEVLEEDATGEYEFRHKTFREYLAARAICDMDEKAFESYLDNELVPNLGNQWWSEVLLFFIEMAAPSQFSKFILKLFDSQKNDALFAEQLIFLKRLVALATGDPVAPFRELLEKQGLTFNRQWFVLDCLRIIGTSQAVEAAEAFKNTLPDNNENRELRRKAAEVVDFSNLEEGCDIEEKVWQSGIEPGMQYLFFEMRNRQGEQSQQDERLQKGVGHQFFMAKYPVTNRLYRRFIACLEEKLVEEPYSLKRFKDKLQEIASIGIWDGVKYQLLDYLYEKDDQGKKMALTDRFRSRFDEDRRFNDNDQPVVGVSWYDARAYCLWLSLVESKGKEDNLYRLPNEAEWEWAAGGGEREYPWGSKPSPTPDYANYNGSKIESTSPVGSYPKGATPDGLYDMAGNVWEWQENWHDTEKRFSALRGGSWFDVPGSLVCSRRDGSVPGSRGDGSGFRVVRPSPL
ncbi:hypothetical protein CHL67_11560 [Prosthecochloris sp. GSB1]|uniref:SUMF1/EgtB/PvdO family nonheme iron enzyme n=1 Tax=Prosthecochloris sp. GSB1 TaxID=281093 RepID=UPI000B8D013E|nr:SUMF1/EgtB/PvdO family nonheme iron enzyme [Prosthecochloris sp. GSB1]ASQ91475.1 hypothetical protein CHL67_11560 [Prosthecochloris sp. GSB1]